MLSQRLRWSTLCDVMHGLLQLHSCWGIQVHHRQAPASTECCRSRRQRHAEVRPRTQPSPARRAALAGRSSAGAVQAVCNGPSMSAGQSTTVHDGLLHLHLRHCSSPASAVPRLPSAVRIATPAFNVRSSDLICGWPGGWNSLPDYLRDPPRSFDSFRCTGTGKVITSFLVY